ncbi:peptidoglycan D,D-transpeptidase FtsI family protein [Amaricoccus macauensis]|uniref:peptidoglycan D,D-transpeptidase FtsI family protein n=1 Tax=Amaricoccus macauensis TaxID=57001 RepID=UPI003C7CF882
MIRRPLRPLARVLSAREAGTNPDFIEAQERQRRFLARQSQERRKAEARLVLLGAVFILGFSAVAGRMALVAAAIPTEPVHGFSQDPITTQRADIVDRNGIVLATNTATASLYAHPHEMVDPVAAAKGLASIFEDLDEDQLLAKFTSGRRFLWIRRTVSPEQRQLVHDLGEPGLLFGPREQRLYPNGSVAAHVLGSTGFGREGVSAAEIVGKAGIERTFDARLRDTERTSEPLRLSLDLPVQSALQEVLAQGMKDMNAVGAAGILMEAKTGRIRAITSLPEFDANFRPALPSSGDPADSPLFNRAAQGRYELGSTFKPLTVAHALENGVVSPHTMIETKGPMKWGRYTIRDFRDYGPRLSVTDVLVKSSNIGTARIAVEMGTESQKALLEELGFFEPVRLEIPEATQAMPLLPTRWSDLTTMTISYGHGIAITPLHLASAYATLANGGYRVTPTLIEDGQITPGPRVFSERTSREVREMMRQVVMRGTAKEADVPGYEIAGKTGTADKPSATGGYERDKVISTFASFFPASDPEYVLIVSLDEPETIINKTRFRTAGLTAAPVAADVIARIAPVLGMRPKPEGAGPEQVLYTLAGNE